MMRSVLLASVATEALAGHCCWGEWGDASTCGNYPASGSGPICGNDGVTVCQSNNDCPDAPAPTPTPPGPSPTPTPPAPTPPPAPPSPAVVGYWSATWEETAVPSNANFGIAFSGWNDPVKAKNESDPLHDGLAGDKWIDAGGGNANGRWSVDWLEQWEAAIKNGELSQWTGIVFDIEECSSTKLADSFASALRTAKAAGLSTLVTTSHSAPYGCGDPDVLMKAFFANDDVDILSPQLYTNGNEAKPSFDAGNQVSWNDWTGSKGKFMPSIGCLAVQNGGYKLTQDFFSQYSLVPTGYIVWPSTGCSLLADATVVA